MLFYKLDTTPPLYFPRSLSVLSVPPCSCVPALPAYGCLGPYRACWMLSSRNSIQVLPFFAMYVSRGIIPSNFIIYILVVSFVLIFHRSCSITIPIGENRFRGCNNNYRQFQTRVYCLGRRRIAKCLSWNRRGIFCPSRITVHACTEISASPYFPTLPSFFLLYIFFLFIFHTARSAALLFRNAKYLKGRRVCIGVG